MMRSPGINARGPGSQKTVSRAPRRTNASTPPGRLFLAFETDAE
jgi:hypothetical protein